MNRAEKMMALAAAKALVKALDDDLKVGARREWEAGGAVKWEPRGIGSLVASFTHDSTTITDPDVFMDWLEARFPTEVVRETVVVRKVRNPAWQTELLAGLQQVDPDEETKPKPGDSMQCRLDDEVVPGVKRTIGGEYHTAAFTPAAGLKRDMAGAAIRFVESGTPMLALMAPSPGRVIEGTATVSDQA